MHCTNANEAMDDTMEDNKWCVQFMDGDQLVTLVEDFTIRFWANYSTKMVCQG